MTRDSNAERGVSLRVRNATPGDAAAMARLLGELGYPADADAMPARLAAVESSGGSTFLVTHDDRVVGLASVAKLSALHVDAPVCYITALVAAPEARGQGVGRLLVSAAEEWARSHGCVRLSVTSAEHRADAHAFYPRCGLPYTGRRFTKILTSPT
ncbi:MAG: GNAT family N-acetyltransferase [Gemmatimonadaceae bacterium]